MEARAVDDSCERIPGGSRGIGIGSAVAVGEINGVAIVKELIVGDAIHEAVIISIND